MNGIYPFRWGTVHLGSNVFFLSIKKKTYQNNQSVIIALKDHLGADGGVFDREDLGKIGLIIRFQDELLYYVMQRE